MQSKKLLAILLACMFTVTLLVGFQSKTTATSVFNVSKASTLKLSVLGKIQSGSRTPVEDKLTPIWREKTKVELEIVQVPEGQDSGQWFQLQNVGGTIPDIIAPSNGIFDNPQVFNTLKSLNILKDISLSDIKKYMPLTAQRLKNWGISIEDWYNANLDTATKKLMYIPGGPNLGSTTVSKEEFVKTDNSYEAYSWYFRDDILKKIFPKAKTEKELRAMYIAKKGKLSFSDINDVPINNLNDLYNYLKKVKALNVKVGSRNVIPAQIQCNSDASSMMWSAFSLPGFFWQDLGDRMYNSSTFAYFAATPEWKNYIKWFNKIYNEKLVGSETFIQKDDQRDAKVINGEYAVVQGWLPINDARKKSVDEKRGYGYRKVDLFQTNTLKNKYQDYNEKNYTLADSWGAIGITKNVKDADMPQILNWIDWNYSEEANIIRAWGPSDFTTGTGKNRAFKPEFNQIKDWALSNNESDKDGIYYGMMPVGGSDVTWNHETYGIGITWSYEYSPKRVYPPELSDAAKVDIDTVYSNIVKLHYYPMIKKYIEKPLGSDVLALKATFDTAEKKFGDIKKTVSFDCDGGKTATIKAIVSKPADFEKNYSDYVKNYLTPEFNSIFKDMGTKWLAYKKLYNTKYRMLVK